MTVSLCKQGSEEQTYHWQGKQHSDKVGNGARDQYAKVQHSGGAALLGLNRSAHMVACREETVVSADGHESSEKCDGPQSHKHDPGDDERAEFRNAKDLQVKERYRRLDETDSEDAGHDERVVVLSNTQRCATTKSLELRTMRSLYRKSTAAAGFAFWSGATRTANKPLAAPIHRISKCHILIQVVGGSRCPPLMDVMRHSFYTSSATILG